MCYSQNILCFLIPGKETSAQLPLVRLAKANENYIFISCLSLLVLDSERGPLTTKMKISESSFDKMFCSNLSFFLFVNCHVIFDA